MTALVEDAPWNSWYVSARNFDGYLVIEGSQWETDDSYRTIKLSLRKEVAAQTIGPGTFVFADVAYRPWYDNPQSWSASGEHGSGTITLTSLTSDGATGTFAFTARALTPNSTPAEYRVTRGTFDVKF